MTTPYTTRIRAIETMIDRIGRDLPETSTARRALQAEARKLQASTAALGDLRASPDPTITLAAHAKRVMTAADKLKAQVTVSRARIHDIVHEGIKELETRIAAKVNLTPNAYAAEIRATFRTMAPAKQHQLLSELAIKNRGPELAALVVAPGILSGLSEDTQNRFRDLILSTHARDEYAEQAALLEAFTDALDITPVAAAVAADFSDPAALAEIERGEAAAAAAVSAFADAVGA